jgi:hypothetical protein
LQVFSYSVYFSSVRGIYKENSSVLINQNKDCNFLMFVSKENYKDFLQFSLIEGGVVVKGVGGLSRVPVQAGVSRGAEEENLPLLFSINLAQI